MNLLMVGAGKGSWIVRGQQLGGALGARVTSLPTAADWDWADLAVLHKKWAPKFAAVARQAHVPTVWDAIDCWEQPSQNGLSQAAALEVLQGHLRVIRPALAIGSTQAQARALNGVYLSHHSWPGLEPTPARPTVQTVGYEGNPAYLGKWLDLVTRACIVRGWRFVLNPPDLREVDILVAFRDGPWDGWMCREWKSGVKLVNALAAGRPILTQISAAALEIEAPTVLVDESQHLDVSLDSVTPVAIRDQVVAHCRARAVAYQLQAIAARYLEILASVRMSCLA